jgi:hypothetical protein
MLNKTAFGLVVTKLVRELGFEKRKIYRTARKLRCREAVWDGLQSQLTRGLPGQW